MTPVMQILECRLGGRCGGCPWILVAPEEQRSRKLSLLPRDWPVPGWVSCGSEKLRDRVDLTWHEGRLGLYGPDREILDLEECPILSEPLEAWLREFRRVPPPIRRGSIRLRVSPSGQRGVWLDFANADVKNLFEDKSYLMSLSERAVVEVGQRHKRLAWIEGAPKLRDPVLEPWFQTYAADGKTIPVYTTVAGFTQSGFVANRFLVSEVLRQVRNSSSRSWLELFAGSGNFSLALAGSGFEVEAVEWEALGVEALGRSAREAGLTLNVRREDLYRNWTDSDKKSWLVDPPRSGLKNLISVIAANLPNEIVYVSCWSESFVLDVGALQKLGYQIVEITGVDQFAHTPHVEWVATLKR